MAGKWKTVKALKTHCWKFFFMSVREKGGFGVNGWGMKPLMKETFASSPGANQPNSQYPTNINIAQRKSENPWLHPENSDPDLWLTFGELCGSCDWNSCVFTPLPPLPSGDKLIWGSLWEIFPDDAYWGVIHHPPPLSLIVSKHPSRYSFHNLHIC